MKKILIHCPNILDGVSYHRVYGPFSKLHKEDRVRITLFSGQKPEDINNWCWYLPFDVMQMSRPYRLMDYMLAQQCKRYGLPLWIDYDDDLLAIPKDNPVYNTFANPKAREMIEATLKLADVITTATEPLAQTLRAQFKDVPVIVIPNGMDERLAKYAKPFTGIKKVSWRGSASHLRDLLYYKEPLKKAVDTHQIPFLFSGLDPWFLQDETTKAKENVFFHPWEGTGLYGFTKEFCEYNASIQMVPLVGHQFNRAKSYLAWIDGTMAGSVCLCPDMPDWSRPGMETYKTDDLNSFSYHLEKLLQMPTNRLKEMWAISWDYINSHLTLSKINEKRMELIQNLTEGKSLNG